jgi:hypothetical protein
MAICLVLGVIVLCATFGSIGFAEKFIRDGWTEAVAGTLRSVSALTATEWARVAGLAIGLSLVASFPVYFSAAPVRARAAFLILYAVLAALAVAVCLSIERWYRFGYRDFPPAGLILAFAVSGLVSACASLAVLHYASRLRISSNESDTKPSSHEA